MNSSNNVRSHFLNPITLLLLLTLSTTLPITPSARKIPLPTNTAVEGVAHARSTLFLGGDFLSGRIILSDAVSGLQTTIVHPPRGRLAIGIATDHKARIVAAAGGGLGVVSFVRDLLGENGISMNDFDAVRPSVHVYDVATGADVASCEIRGAGAVNDVVIGGGFVYATDSLRPFVYRFKISAFPRCYLKRVPLPRDVFSGDGFRANGIEVFKGGLLVVNAHTDSLHFIDLKRNNTASVVLADGKLPGGDGIAVQWSPKKGGETRLYAADTVNNRVNVYALKMQSRTRTVKALARGLIRSDTFSGRTTTVAVGGGFVVVPNFNATAGAVEGTLAENSLACAKL